MGFKAATTKPKSVNWKRYIDGVEIKPSMYVGKNGKSVIGGSVDGEVILDKDLKSKGELIFSRLLV